MSSYTFNADRAREKNHRIDLDRAATAWLTISHIAPELEAYATDRYQALFDLHPPEKSRVVASETTVPANRWYKSYLNTPSLDPDFLKARRCSYMFAAFDTASSVKDDLPDEFKPFLEGMNEIARDRGEPLYNQVVVNWYADGSDYLPFHGDWEYGRAKNSSIATITLNEQLAAPCRTFTLKPHKSAADDAVNTRVDIVATHGSIITMHGETQKKFKHGIQKYDAHASAQPLSRISITFRSFE